MWCVCSSCLYLSLPPILSPLHKSQADRCLHSPYVLRCVLKMLLTARVNSRLVSCTLCRNHQPNKQDCKLMLKVSESFWRPEYSSWELSCFRSQEQKSEAVMHKFWCLIISSSHHPPFPVFRADDFLQRWRWRKTDMNKYDVEKTQGLLVPKSLRERNTRTRDPHGSQSFGDKGTGIKSKSRINSGNLLFFHYMYMYSLMFLCPKLWFFSNL